MTNIVQARRLARPRRRSAARESDFFPLDGGMNLVDSELTIDPGQLRSAMNYEMGVDGGYERVGGYEKLTGTTVGPDETYALLEYRSSQLAGPSFTTGEIIKGGTSTDQGLLLAQTNTLGGDNAQLHSEDLSNASFYGLTLTMTPGVYTVPPGQRIAMMDKAEKILSSIQFVISLQVHVLPAGQKAHVSIFARLNGTNNIITLNVGADPSNTVSFDLSTGAIVISGADDAGMEHLVDGIYRCWMVTRVPSGPPGNFFAFVGVRGNSGESVFLQGLQVIIGADSDRPGYGLTTTTATPIDCGDVVLYNNTGIFQDGEPLTGLSSAEVAVAEGTAVQNGETDPLLHSTYKSLAILQAVITPPPGSGPIRGVWLYKGILYNLRDNAGATAGRLYKEDIVGGWTEIPMLYRIGFDAGSKKLFPGDALDNGVGSTGTVEAYQIISGSVAIGDAAGWIWISNQIGAWVDNDPIEIGATNVATVDGTPAVPVIPAGGKYEFRTKAFPSVIGGSSGLRERMYFTGGVGHCLVFDDTIEGAGTEETLISIDDGMPTGLSPGHLAFHNEYLFLGYPNGSIQNSAVTDPLSFNPIFGASEINMGAALIGFQEEIGDVLICFSRDEVRLLEGKSRATFRLGDFNVKTGAHEWSIQRLATAMFFDDRGFGTLQSTDRYGDYQDNTISSDIQPLIDTLLRDTSVRCSQLYRGRNIYRCFFADGTWISIGTRNNKISGLMLCSYPGIVANVCCSEEDVNGVERLYIGADDGFVYQQELSTSFDGGDIIAHIRPGFHHSGNPNRLKKYLQAELDAVVTSPFTITSDFRYDDGREEQDMAEAIDQALAEDGGYWDEFTWDEFTWDAGLARIGAIKIDGEGTNISCGFRHQSNNEKRHTLRGVTLIWTHRRRDRRAVHG